MAEAYREVDPSTLKLDPTDQARPAAQPAYGEVTGIKLDPPVEPPRSRQFISGPGDTLSQQVVSGVKGIGQDIAEAASGAKEFGGDVVRALLPGEEGARAGGRVVRGIVGKLGDIGTFVTGGLTEPIGPTGLPTQVAGRAAGMDVRPTQRFDVTLPQPRLEGPQPRLALPGPEAGYTPPSMNVQPPGLPPPPKLLPPPDTTYVPGEGWITTGEGMIPGRPGATARAPTEQPPVGPEQAPVVVRPPRPGEPEPAAPAEPEPGPEVPRHPAEVYAGRQRIEGQARPAAPRPQPAADLSEAITSDSQSALDRLLAAADEDPKTIRRYRRAIIPGRPLGRANRDIPTVRNQNRQILTTIDRIIGNKQNLQLTDRYGLPMEVKQNPQSVRQLADALEQTKRQIFHDYDEMARRDPNLRVSLKPAADAMREAANRFATRIRRPELRQKLLQEANRIEGESGSASDIQNLIEDYNQTLQAWYRAGQPDRAVTEIAADGAAARAMRHALDEAISKVAGPGYQELRNAYGALRATETGIANAIVRIDQRLPAGLVGQFADLIGPEEIARGILTLNPEAIVRGISIRAMKKIYQRLNDPNRAIRLMFRDRERRLTAGPTVGARVSARVGTELGRARQRLYDVQHGDLSPYIRSDEIGPPPP